ncbi:hypothetical protein B296_00048231 [Ensete ventricosum]|uniref:Uncharacterized protein n=1 Tax=Ensete ventricosum TaxID=4639 RepID=A0A426YVK8_ENSVE|nr:hypothetical protein B296_00048231 [Ensete ventricosum]
MLFTHRLTRKVITHLSPISSSCHLHATRAFPSLALSTPTPMAKDATDPTVGTGDHDLSEEVRVLRKERSVLQHRLSIARARVAAVEAELEVMIKELGVMINDLGASLINFERDVDAVDTTSAKKLDEDRSRELAARKAEREAAVNDELRSKVDHEIRRRKDMAIRFGALAAVVIVVRLAKLMQI